MTPFTMTGLRLNILEIAGTKGIPDWAYRHFKPNSKRTVNFLLKEGILERNNTATLCYPLPDARFTSNTSRP